MEPAVRAHHKAAVFRQQLLCCFRIIFSIAQSPFLIVAKVWIFRSGICRFGQSVVPQVYDLITVNTYRKGNAEALVVDKITHFKVLVCQVEVKLTIAPVRGGQFMTFNTITHSIFDGDNIFNVCNDIIHIGIVGFQHQDSLVAVVDDQEIHFINIRQLIACRVDLPVVRIADHLHQRVVLFIHRDISGNRRHLGMIPEIVAGLTAGFNRIQFHTDFHEFCHDFFIGQTGIRPDGVFHVIG